MSNSRLSCGKDFSHCFDINKTLDEGCKAGFDFVCLPLVNPRFKREFIEGPACERPGPFTRSDLVLTGQDWSSLIVAKVSPWIQVDSCVDTVRKNSEKALKQELMLASHLSTPAIMLRLDGQECSNMARIINEHLLSGHNHQFWIQVPLVAPSETLDDVIEDEQAESVYPWHWWNRLKTMCDYQKKIGLCIRVGADLPDTPYINRWLGEPIKSCILPTNIFLTNKKGFPVLSKKHQDFVKTLFRLDVQMIISGVDRHPDKGIKTYYQYLSHLYQNLEPMDNVSEFAKGYEDYLQCPLQPLMDNLDSQTYEVFEKDPVKYSQYQKAVYKALLDRIPEAEKDTKILTLMVVGAGRGPLVTASLTAAAKADRKIKVYAVEKNPNAVVTLQNLQYEMWGEQVTVVSTDMRVWNPAEKADILVSELLGSFGDNELSPECLDGAQKFLKDDGISIPHSYTSFLAPVSSSKLWNESRLCKETGKPPEAPFETPYVVRLHNIFSMHKAKPLFYFEHPNRANVIDNNRYKSVEFPLEIDAVLHGFAGYFDCILYDDIHISIVPETHSPGMFSWFPIYFPIKEPLHLQDGDNLRVHFWRINNGKNVWYEWCVTDPECRPIHNPKGRSYTIGL